MLRRVLVISLVLATAAGPRLCCCAPLHLIAGARQQAPDTAAAAEKRVPAEVPTCCQQAHAPAAAAAAKAGHDAPHRPAEKCPCRKHGETPAAVVGQNDARANFEAAPLAVASAVDLAVLFTPLVAAPAPTAAVPAHLLCGEQILYAFHQLRC